MGDDCAAQQGAPAIRWTLGEDNLDALSGMSPAEILARIASEVVALVAVVVTVVLMAALGVVVSLGGSLVVSLWATFSCAMTVALCLLSLPGSLAA